MSRPIKVRKPAEGDGGPGNRQESRFVHKVRVRWGDCDPAAIAYTANIPGWALEAIEAWWEHYAGIDWYHINIDRNVGTPFVHMTMNFTAPITPRHMLECEVALKKRGSSSVTHRVLGYQNDVLCFEGEFVSVFVDAKEMKPRTPPPDILSAIERTEVDSS
jgi:acyl-CoA thioesterase FadM